MENAVPQWCVDAVVSLMDGILDESLVLGFADPGRHDVAAVVGGKVVHAVGQIRRPTVAFLHGRPQVVGHDKAGNSTEVLQRCSNGIQKVLNAL